MKTYVPPGSPVLVGAMGHLEPEGDTEDQETDQTAPPEATNEPTNPPLIDDGRPYRIAEHVRANVTDDGLVILDIDKGEIYSANVVAGQVWKQLLEGKSVDAIIEQLIAETDQSKEQVRRDVERFVSTVTTKGLLTK